MPTATTSRTTPSTRVKARTVWIGAAVLLVLVTLGLRLLLQEKVYVRTAAVSYQDLVNTLPTNGKVEPVQNYEAHSPYPASVKHLYVQQGDKVKAGQLLLTMDDADAQARVAASVAALRSAQLALQSVQQGGSQEERNALTSQIAGAQLARDQAAQNLASLQKLSATGAASESEVGNAQQRLKQTDQSLQTLKQRASGRFSPGDVARAQAQLADAKAGYDAAVAVVNQANVRAPFAGTVYSIPVQQSDFVPAGNTLLQLADLTKIRIRAFFDEPEIGKLGVGQPVKVIWDAKPGRSWSGHIERVPSTIIAYGTRNVGEALITVDDSDGTLLPNTNVTVTVTILRKQHVLSVPREALRIEGTDNFVFKLVGNKAVRTPVTIGALNLTNVEILGGVQKGDIVVLGATGGQKLTNDMQVELAQ